VLNNFENLRMPGVRRTWSVNPRTLHTPHYKMRKNTAINPAATKWCPRPINPGISRRLIEKYPGLKIIHKEGIGDNST
jgi:hypothetical protein